MTSPARPDACPPLTDLPDEAVEEELTPKEEEELELARQEVRYERRWEASEILVDRALGRDDQPGVTYERTSREVSDGIEARRENRVRESNQAIRFLRANIRHTIRTRARKSGAGQNRRAAHGGRTVSRRGSSRQSTRGSPSADDPHESESESDPHLAPAVPAGGRSW